MKKVRRPWGNFKQFVTNKKCTVKILTINSKQELSLQKHNKREELWYFLTDGKIQLGSRKKRIREGELIKVPRKVSHRIISDKKTVKVLEISLGKFEEKDEIRLDDKYGRK